MVTDLKQASVDDVTLLFDDRLLALVANDQSAMLAVLKAARGMEVDPEPQEAHGYLVKMHGIQVACAKDEEISCSEAMDYLEKWSRAVAPARPR